MHDIAKWKYNKNIAEIMPFVHGRVIHFGNIMGMCVLVIVRL